MVVVGVKWVHSHKALKTGPGILHAQIQSVLPWLLLGEAVKGAAAISKKI